jgi:hypothetical protein
MRWKLPNADVALLRTKGKEMSSMWPFWKRTDETDCGVYRLMHFIGVKLTSDGPEHARAVFENIRGHLNFSCPISDIGSHQNSIMAWASPEEAREDLNRRERYKPFPCSVGELARRLWSVLPGEIINQGLTRPEFYKREIALFIERQRGIEDED